jgi:antitoxin VapB
MSIKKSSVSIEAGVQLINLPAEAGFPSNIKKVVITTRGNERIITPTKHSWDRFFLDGPKVSDDFMS